MFNEIHPRLHLDTDRFCLPGHLCDQDFAMAKLEDADAMLIVGSSLMVYSGFRFVQAAARRGMPISAINLGRTRADYLLALKIEERIRERSRQPTPSSLKTTRFSLVGTVSCRSDQGR
jgi:NAD-dependent SIR2 family protein deacetylase